jgi:hypothetical protein
MLPEMSERYVIRPDPEAFTIVDLWTGEAAVIAMSPQTGLPREDAEHTAQLLNRRVREEDRSVGL